MAGSIHDGFYGSGQIAFYGASDGITHQLSGSTAGTSTASATLRYTARFTETGGNGVSTASANLRVTHPLTETGGNGVSTASANLRVTHPLTETGANGVSTASATMRALWRMTETGGNGVSTASANIRVTHPLTETGANGVSTASANLRATHPLTTSTAGASATSANLRVTHPLTETGANGVSTAGANLRVTHILTETGANGVSTVSATMRALWRMAGISNGVAGASATAARPQSEPADYGIPAYGTMPYAGEYPEMLGTGSSAGTSTASANVRVTHPLTETGGNGVSSASATMRALWRMTSSTAGTSTASANVRVTHPLTETGANGVSSASATMRALWRMNGSSAGVSTASANVRVLHLLTETGANGVSTASANVRVTHPLTETGANGVSTASATMRALWRMAGSTAGVSTASANVRVSHPLTETGADGVSTASANVRVTHPLTETGASGVSTASATMRAAWSMNATSAGVSTASATMRTLWSMTASTAGVSTASANVRIAKGLEGRADGEGLQTASNASFENLTLSPWFVADAATLSMTRSTAEFHDGVASARLEMLQVIPGGSTDNSHYLSARQDNIAYARNGGVILGAWVKGTAGKNAALRATRAVGGSSIFGGGNSADRSATFALNGSWQFISMSLEPLLINLLTVNQASLETDTSGWGASGNSTVARVTTQAASFAGTASLEVTSTVASGTMFAQTSGGASGRPVVPGNTYTAIVNTKASTVTRSVQVWIRFFNSGGGQVGDGPIATATNSTSTFNQINTAPTYAPPTAVFAAICVGFQSVGSIGEIHYIDKASLHNGTSTSWVLPGNTTAIHIRVGMGSGYAIGDVMYADEVTFSPAPLVEVLHPLAVVGTNAVSTASANVRIVASLSETGANGVSTASANMRALWRMTGSSAGASTASANIRVSHPLTETGANGVSTASATMRASWRMNTASAGVSTASANLRATHPIAGRTNGGIPLLVTNGDFEDPANTGWIVGASASRSTSQSHSGSASMWLVKSVSAGYQPYLQSSPRHAADANQVYIVSVWYRPSPGCNTQPVVRLTAYNAAGGTLGSVGATGAWGNDDIIGRNLLPSSPVSTWNRFVLKTQPTPAGTASLFFHIFHDATAGQLEYGYIDDIELQTSFAAVNVVHPLTETGANGVSTASATMRALWRMNGSTAGTSTASANVRVLHPLTETGANGVSTASATMRAAWRMNGSSAGVSTASATMRALWRMNGSSVGTSTASATMRALWRMTETGGNGVSTASANLRVSHPLSESGANGVSSASATMRALWRMTGSSSGVSTASANVRVLHILTETGANGVSTASANVRVFKRLTETGANGVSTASANVRVFKRLIGTSAGISSAYATMRAHWRMRGATHGVGAIHGVLYNVIYPDGIPSQEGIGYPSVGVRFIRPDGIPSTEGVGTPTISAFSDWWSTAHLYRRAVDVGAPAEMLPLNHPVEVFLPALQLQGKARTDFEDIEVVRLDEGQWQRVPRQIVATSDGLWIRFMITDPILAADSVRYYVYYGAPGEDGAGRQPFVDNPWPIQVPYTSSMIDYLKPTQDWHDGKSLVRGATAVFRFNGTAVRFFGEKGPDQAVAELMLDDEPTRVNADYYSLTRQVSELYRREGLVADPHKLRVKSSFRSNVNSFGSLINVSRFEYVASVEVVDQDEEVLVDGWTALVMTPAGG
jgi:hypothetical protein